MIAGTIYSSGVSQLMDSLDDKLTATAASAGVAAYKP
jgi:hypothetical protein